MECKDAFKKFNLKLCPKNVTFIAQYAEKSGHSIFQTSFKHSKMDHNRIELNTEYWEAAQQ